MPNENAVSLLLGRQAIRPVTCAGGRTVMVLTSAGGRKAKNLRSRTPAKKGA